MDLSRFNVAPAVLLASTEKSLRLVADGVAEIRNVAGNTADPDLKIQLEALANKWDEAAAAVVAEVQISDGVGVEAEKEPPAETTDDGGKTDDTAGDKSKAK